MTPEIQAVIFDMDGVLVDSELYWSQDEEKFWHKIGITHSEELSKDIRGRKIEDSVVILQKKYNVNIPYEQFKIALNEMAINVYKNHCNLLPGVQELIDALFSAGIPMSLASSSPRNWIEAVFEKFNLAPFFQYVLSAQSDHIPGKPKPDIYTQVIQLNKKEPRQCAVIEDTWLGIEAGKASGAFVIAVPDERWSRGDFSKADYIAKTLQDKNVYKFLGI